MVERSGRAALSERRLRVTGRVRAIVWTVNILVWPTIQLGIGRWMLRRPSTEFAREGALTRLRPWETARLYRRVLRVPAWKPALPDGASWLGQPSRLRLSGRDRHDLAATLAETRRGELAHWYMLLCTPFLFLWNPPWACLVLGSYGIAANVPCIVAQRYNRMRLFQTMRQPEPR